MHLPPHKKALQGFTLIEVVIVTLIMGIIGIVLLSTLRTISQSWSTLQEKGDKLSQVQRIYLATWYDFSQVTAYPIAFSAMPTPLMFNNSGGDIYLLHNGWNNPFGEQRSQLQYVHYVTTTNPDYLLRRYIAPISALASAMNIGSIDGLSQTQHRLLAEGISSFEATVTDQNQIAHSSWPTTPGSGNSPDAPLPQLVTLHMHVEPYGDMETHIPLLSLPPKPNAKIPNSSSSAR